MRFPEFLIILFVFQKVGLIDIFRELITLANLEWIEINNNEVI